MITFLLSSFPILDWNGTDFLIFYAVALVMAGGWSWARRHQYLNSFNPAKGACPELSHPIEIAYLAGGASRCTEVAIVHLIEGGFISWNATSGLGNGRLQAIAAPPSDSHWLEKSLYSEISLRGAAGMPLSSIGPAVMNGVMSVEGKLAKLGLRPTDAEISRRRSSSVLPLIALLVFGFVRVILGLSREEPVGFLILFLAFTIAVMIIITAGLGSITPVGKHIVNRLQKTHETAPDARILGVALFGIAGSTAYANCPELDPSLIKEFQKSHKLGANGCGGGGCSAGSGCSWGGGGNGCGGGGGGCGGCGS